MSAQGKCSDTTCGYYIGRSIQDLKNWYQSTFLGRSCGQLFFIFADFFFGEEKKRAVTFQTISVYFCTKFAEKGCISEFLSEKHPISKKKSSETESGKSRY